MEDDNRHATTSIIRTENTNGNDKTHVLFKNSSFTRRERKGGSYVWNYSDKLSRHTVRCKLCNKVMSFHGTANVITHLQRKHNIVGKMEKCDSPSTISSSINDINNSDDNYVVEHLEDAETTRLRRHRRSSATASIVWKYCTRVTKDVVRCGFCKKNLSYQGTSNLQRHLHRMHGVVTHGRIYKDSEFTPDLSLVNTEYIWDHCSIIDEAKAKCNMCNEIFEYKDTEDILKHLTITHSIEPPRIEKVYEEVEEDQWSKLDEIDTDAPQFQEYNIKKDDIPYDDIIVEEDSEVVETFDENPIYSNIVNDMQLSNPLSPQSSIDEPERKFKVREHFINNPQLQKLNEECLRMETKYFREKAGYYRMLQQLTALKAKKVVIELERLHNPSVINATFAPDNIEIHDNLQT